MKRSVENAEHLPLWFALSLFGVGATLKDTEGLFITLMHPEDMEMNGFIGGMGGLSLANGHRGHAASNASLLAPRLSLLPQSACSSSLQALQAPEGNPEVPVAYQLSSGPCDEHKSYAFIQRYESTRSSVAPAVRQ
ncbi:unnamed protein product [Fusarium graminearum]|uniref:Uncharacterized protein n=1 Tax=Gibberella zeae (strain ATCC MYA-4620 / CBS 123657 / FGSC 9075 / NRRL 31084 / PH-1) TaxID=229533 RepID=I1RVQ7_GIBZE|nr:hypothetical protein FGSG_08344 [Fusarium graminearum PH-1]ESU15017.1 hypothetical protein FGSG_08344 [Fusarium graminearum PH-1]CZS79951.1 unnamed protein product [Fusarium graminearum]|eukprot:XP_011320442.1 hypothetical protein FGSG_08344 [Fusarium graminearum PH-1]